MTPSRSSLLWTSSLLGAALALLLGWVVADPIPADLDSTRAGPPITARVSLLRDDSLRVEPRPQAKTLQKMKRGLRLEVFSSVGDGWLIAAAEGGAVAGYVQADAIEAADVVQAIQLALLQLNAPSGRSQGALCDRGDCSAGSGVARWPNGSEYRGHFRGGSMNDSDGDLVLYDARGVYLCSIRGLFQRGWPQELGGSADLRFDRARVRLD